MKIRHTLLVLGLALAATSAFAATPQATTAVKPAAAAKTVQHHDRACAQRSKLGKCEKWAADAKPAAAAKTEKKS